MALIAGLSAAFALLLLIAAALTASLTAVLGIGPGRVRTLAEEGFAGAGALARLRSEDDADTATLSLLRAICTLGATVAGVALVAELWSVQELWIGGPLVVLGVLFVGELGPRALAGKKPVRLALIAAPRLHSVARLCRGVLFPLTALGRVLGRKNAGRRGVVGRATGARSDRDRDRRGCGRGRRKSPDRAGLSGSTSSMRTTR